MQITLGYKNLYDLPGAFYNQIRQTNEDLVMATRPNIPIPPNTWVDVYTALNNQAGFPSVTVGEALNIALLGDSTVRLSEKSTEPVAGDGFREVTTEFITYSVTSGSPGVWAYSPTVAAQINVEVG